MFHYNVVVDRNEVTELTFMFVHVNMDKIEHNGKFFDLEVPGTTMPITGYTVCNVEATTYKRNRVETGLVAQSVAYRVHTDQFSKVRGRDIAFLKALSELRQLHFIRQKDILPMKVAYLQHFPSSLRQVVLNGF